MVRTQIQFTEEQVAGLKRLSAAESRSMADLVREGVNRLLRSGDEATRNDRLLRAARVFGKFRSGASDLADHHDAHFADSVGHRR